MRKNLYKYALMLRILTAGVAFFLACGAFAGISAWWPSYQPGPAFLALFAAFGVFAASVAGGHLLAAFVFGRFYCSCMCPLGIYQDAVSFPSRGKLRTGRKNRIVRYWILGVVVASAGIFGTAWMLRILEPYSIFGAVASNAEGGWKFGIGRFLVTGVLPLLFFTGLVLWKKRFFCTTVCPVGTVLGLCAEKGLLRLRIDRDTCVKCGKCERVCPAGCIHPAEGTVDNGSCLRCMRCVGACPKGSVGFSFRRTDAGSEKKTDSSFRVFLIAGASAAVGFAAGRRLRKKKNIPAFPKVPSAIYPPGAGSPERFAAFCTSCRLCVANCTGKVLCPPGGGVPFVHLDYRNGMCEFNCMKCLSVCPTGALRKMPLAEKKRCRIGLAEFFPDECIAVVDGTACGACAEHCPTGALRMVKKEWMTCSQPQLEESLCIGCGNCEYPCPVKAVRVRPSGIQVQAADPNVFFRKGKTEAASSDEWLI